MNTKDRQPQQSIEILIIAKGAGIVFFGSIIGTFLKYLFELITARHLGPELFGVFFLAFTAFKILERISVVGLHNGVLRYIALYRGAGDESRIKGTIILSLKITFIMGGLITLLLLILSDPLSNKIFHAEGLGLILRIFALGIIFSGITEILVFSTQAFQIMKYKVMVRMIFEPLLRILSVIIVFILGWQLIGAAFAFLGSIVLGTLLALYYLKKVFPQITDHKIHPVYEVKSILNFSWPLFFVGFINLFLMQINTIMLGHYRISAEVGIFGAVQRTAFLIPIILDSFNSIFAPMISDLYHKKEQKKISDLYKIITKWIFSISFPLFLLMLFLAKELLSLWGKEFVTGSVSLVVICIAQLINCAVGPAGFILMMTGYTKLSLINTIIVLATVISLNIILIPKYGILGAALGLGIAITIINLMRLLEIYFLFKIHPYRIDIFKPLLAGGTTYLILLLLRNLVGKVTLDTAGNLLYIVAASAIFLFVYGANLYLLKISKEEKLLLERIKLKLLKKRDM
ncbi:MAG: flippase [Spirochaetes bacterium]|nr:flippase [Spirochaetota bacterium]